MFKLGQLWNTRIRAAERALRDGRLDEAFRVVMAADVREDKRSQAVLESLSAKFLERAREHYRADRFSEALADLDRAQVGANGEAGLVEQIAELRKFVQTVAAETNRNDASRRRRLEEAVRRIEDGSLAAGKRILEAASADDHAAAKAKADAENKVCEMWELIGQAEAALSANQYAAAADRLSRAKAVDAHAAEVIRLEAEVAGRVLSAARASIAEGRIGRAASELACLGRLGARLPERQDVGNVVALAQEAAGHVRAGNYPAARQSLMSLFRMMPQARWAERAMEQVRQIEELQAELLAGPLGEKTPLGPPLATGEARGLADASPARFEETIALPKSGPQAAKAAMGGVQPAAKSAEKLLLLVDGGGSFLLVRGAEASVGRVAADHPADVPIFSDLAERHMNVSRVEDDYFAFATKDIEIGGRKTLHTLLRDGDRVVLGRKAKFTFRKPSRRSASAVLELSDTTKMPNDVRRVVLFDRTAMIGVGPNVHVPCRHAGAPLVLYERQGAFWVRRQDDGHADTSAKELPIGETVEVGGVSMVLRPWTMKA